MTEADLAGLPPAPVLGGAAVVLEPLRVAHAEELGPLLDDARLHHFTGGSPDTVPQLRARYEKQVVGRSPDDAQVWWSWVVRARTDGQALGYVQATGEVTDGVLTAHLAWVVAVPHQGTGAATAAAWLMVAWLRQQGVQRLVADVHPEHGASQAVAAALGLTETDEIVDGELRWARTLAHARPPLNPVHRSTRR